MKMEKSEDDKFIKFNSEAALRKGDNGWIVNAFIENRRKITTSQGKQLYKFQFGYIFTKKELGTNKKTESWFFWDGGTSYSLSKIHLQIPKKDENPWYSSNELVNDMNDQDSSHNQTEISFASKKEWSGVWISDDSPKNPWIFENLEVWGNEKKYSEVFYKLEDNTAGTAGSETAYKIENPHSKTWFENTASGNSTGTGAEKVTPTSIDIREKIKEMINTIKDLKGNWMDLNEVCGWRWNRNIGNYQLDKLKMYCSK